MRRWTTITLTLAVLFTAAATANAQAKKPTGAWSKTADGAKVVFDFKAEGLRATITNGNATLDIEADYGITKDGTIYGIITKVERKGIDGGPDKGELFSFKLKQDKDTLTISELKSTSGGADAGHLVNGDYKKEGK